MRSITRKDELAVLAINALIQHKGWNRQDVANVIRCGKYPAQYVSAYFGGGAQEPVYVIRSGGNDTYQAVDLFRAQSQGGVLELTQDEQYAFIPASGMLSQYLHYYFSPGDLTEIAKTARGLKPLR